MKTAQETDQIEKKEEVQSNSRENFERQTQKYPNYFRSSKWQLGQTTIEQSYPIEVKTFQHFSQKSQIKSKSPIPSNLNQSQILVKHQSYLLEMINHYIYQIAERNEAIHANYTHFLMLLYLTILQIALNIYASQNLIETKKLIFTKLQKLRCKNQIDQCLYYDFMTFILRKEKISSKLIHAFIRKIMTTERQVCIAVFPYYFNMFAMVVNKEIIFNGEVQENLIPYTFEITHQKRFNGNFSRAQVFAEMRKVQKLSIEKYHSQEL